MSIDSPTLSTSPQHDMDTDTHCSRKLRILTGLFLVGEAKDVIKPHVECLLAYIKSNIQHPPANDTYKKPKSLTPYVSRKKTSKEKKRERFREKLLAKRNKLPFKITKLAHLGPPVSSRRQQAASEALCCAVRTISKTLYGPGHTVHDLLARFPDSMAQFFKIFGFRN